MPAHNNSPESRRAYLPYWAAYAVECMAAGVKPFTFDEWFPMASA